MLRSIKKITELPKNSLLFPGMRMYTTDVNIQMESITRLSNIPYGIISMMRNFSHPGHEYSWLNVKFIDFLQAHLVSSPALKHGNTEVKVSLCMDHCDIGRRIDFLSCRISCTGCLNKEQVN